MKKYHFDDNDYLRFCELIQTRTGIRVADSRREVLARALKEIAESMACEDLNQFFSYLLDARTDSEIWDDLIKKVTIGETYFFRDTDYIEALRHNILPDLIARHQNDHTLRLWSAGCASGEEPYTLAILLRQILSDINQWKILILATDINRHSLSQAAAGCYRAWSFRETDPAVRASYFSSEGDTFILDPSVRKMVTFAYLNLAEDGYPSFTQQMSDFDLILCRNVTIYLPKSLIHEIANRFYQCLSDDGWLMVGPSETHLEIYSQFQTLNFHGAIAYQKVSGIPTQPSFWTPAPEQRDRPAARLQAELPPVMKTPTQSDVSYAADLPSSLVGKPFAASFHSPAHDMQNVDKGLATNLEVPHERHQAPSSKEEPGASEWAELCQQGEAFMKRHRYDEARDCFLACLSKKTGFITALYRLACLEANVGRLNEARKWAEQALDHDPLRSEVHYTLALVHQVQGELQEAISRLKKAIYLDSNFILAHFGLFYLYQRIGNPNEAERHRTLAVHLASKLSPDTVLPGSDDLTAKQLLTMAQAVPNGRLRC